MTSEQQFFFYVFVCFYTGTTTAVPFRYKQTSSTNSELNTAFLITLYPDASDSHVGSNQIKHASFLFFFSPLLLIGQRTASSLEGKLGDSEISDFLNKAQANLVLVVLSAGDHFCRHSDNTVLLWYINDGYIVYLLCCHWNQKFFLHT